MDTTIIHMYEFHAIYPEEKTTCMRLKIRDNIQSRAENQSKEKCIPTF
jgi:hypothetical protein